MELKRYLLYGTAVFIISLIVSFVALFIFFGRDSGFEVNYVTLLCMVAIGLAAVFIFVGPSFFADWQSIRKAKQRYKRDS